MPRNYPRFRQNAPQNGPLMTNHIELQDLDLELELLKRKRQMIEKQQQQFANERRFSNQSRNYNYIESAPQQQYNPNQIFSHNFGQSGPTFNRYEGGQGSSLGKRPSDSRWNTSSAPKRLSGPSGGSQKKFGASFKSRSDSLADRPAPFVNQQGPFSKQHSQIVTQSQQQQVWNQLPFYMGNKYTPPSQRFNSTKSKPTHTDFRPNKVTKPKGKTANIANKLVSYPIPKRNVPPKEVINVASKADEKGDFILHADKVPTQQVAGRLELALGSILKDVKQIYSDIDEYKASFLHHIFLREVKQAIRERLRTVMLGKHVGKVGDIVEHYRNVFPLESDKEIVDLAMEALNVVKRKQLITKLEETDSPENYFKINMNKLLDASLDEMFKKLQKLYEDESTDDTKELFNEILNISLNVSDEDVDNKDTVKIAEAAEDAESKENAENAANSENVISNENIDNIESVETAESKQSLENTEAVESEENSKKTEATESEQNDEKNKKNEEPNIENKEKNENKDDENISQVNTEANASKDANAVPQSTRAVRDTSRRHQRLETYISNTINRKMASLLPKYKFHIMRILRANQKYNATKKFILAKLKYKLSIANQKEAAGKRSASVKIPEKASPAKPSASTPAATPSSNIPYYVKVHGRPNLPRKAEMQSFLQKFNPKTVKKHRSMQLLFVGFDNKEDFDKMVAIQETTIDGKKIIFKASEVANRNQKPLNVSVISDDDEEVQVITSDTSANTSTNIISSDLDGQIDDLLSSIRKEEELTVDKPVDATKEVAADESVAKQNENDNSEVQEIANGVQNEVVTVDSENDVEEVADNGGNDVEMVTNDDASAETLKDKDAEVESESNNTTENVESEAVDKVEALKSDAKQTGKATPTRASARLNSATPSSIRTRRASRLAQD